MFFSRRISMVKLFFIGLITITVIMSCFHWGQWYYLRNRNFENEINELRGDYIAQKKEIISREVDSAIEFSRFQRRYLEEQARLELKNRVDEAHGMAVHLYEHYTGSKSDAEIFELIKEALCQFRFNNNGYFFILNQNGTAELLPLHPELAGKNLLSIDDADILGLSKPFTALVSAQQEGFLKYRWFKPNSGKKQYDKLTFVKHFAPAGWYIGTGFYLEDLEQKIQQTVLKQISEIRFGKDGFLFALDFDSRMVVHAENALIGNRMLDSKFKSIREAFPQMLSESESHGAFIEYSYRRPGHQKISSKISYVARIPEWEWLVGAGFFLDTIDGAIAAKRQQLTQDLAQDTWRMLLLSLFAIACSALIARLLAAKLHRNIAMFTSFFARASSESTRIKEQNLLFSEFEKLGQAANKMIDDRRQSETDRKQLEAQLMQRQKLESIGTLAGGIAHDFNNLLAAICGNMTLLKMRLDPESPLHKYLGRMNEATDNAKGLINQILCFSRFSEGEKFSLDFVTEIKACLDLLRASIPSSVNIETELPASFCPIVANKTQLHQVLMNLCNNAYQALPNQSGTIFLKLSVLDGSTVGQLPATFVARQGKIAHLAINDNGSGIEQDLLNKIFDPFFTTKQKDKGTGLGLSIAHRIISNLKGALEVDSQPGVGSTFHIYLPLSTEQSAIAVTAEGAAPICGDGTVVLVDDDEKVLLSTKELLQQIGYQVRDFNLPQAALAYLREKYNEVSAIITDQTMPAMSGLELIEQVQLLSTEIPIVLCTGYSAQINENTLKELKVTQLMTKPVDIGQLSRILHHLTRVAASERG